MEYASKRLGSSGKRATAAAPAGHRHQLTSSLGATELQRSPAMVAQAKVLSAVFGPAAQLKSDAASMEQPPGVMQQVKWKSDGSNDSTKAGLNAQLSAGVTAAVASPAAKPGSLKPWVTARVKEDQKYDDKVAEIPGKAKTKAESNWDKAKGAKLKNVPLDQQQKVQDDFVAAAAAKEKSTLEVLLNNVITQHVELRLAELKWPDAFVNKDGDLPGNAGAGGYDEYYAEPSPGDPVADGFWGQNRVLHATAGDWYVTADHYVNYVRVTDP